MDIEILFEAVRAALRESRLDLGNPAEFGDLVRVVGDRVPDMGGDAAETQPFITLVGMGLLGPATGLPDDHQVVELTHLAETFCKADDVEAILDLVATYGCGWQREIGAGSGWDGLWPASFTAMSKRVHLVCQLVSRLLHKTLFVDYPASDEAVSSLLETAANVTKILVQPQAPGPVAGTLAIQAGHADGDPIFAGLSVTSDRGWEEAIPAGARAVYQCTDGTARDERTGAEFAAGNIVRMLSSDTRSNVQIRDSDNATSLREIRPTAGDHLAFSGDVALSVWGCTCGRKDCASLHRLQSWDPAAEYGELKTFLLSAVRGQMQKRRQQAEKLKAKDFAQSLLGSYWARHGCGDGARLRLTEQLVHRLCTNPECPGRTHQGAAHTYAGSRCDRCATPATDRNPLVAVERLIVVGSAIESWSLGEYWRCGNAECQVPGPPAGRQTLIRAETAIREQAGLCTHCGERLFTDSRVGQVAECLTNAATALQGAIALNELRRQTECPHCERSGEPAAYCTACSQQGRPPALPASPSWFFAPAVRD